MNRYRLPHEPATRKVQIHQALHIGVILAHLNAKDAEWDAGRIAAATNINHEFQEANRPLNKLKSKFASEIAPAHVSSRCTHSQIENLASSWKMRRHQTQTRSLHRSIDIHLEILLQSHGSNTRSENKITRRFAVNGLPRS